MADALIVVGAVLALYALVADRLSRTALTGPMVFTAVGLLIGPELLDLVELDLEDAAIETLLNTTLAVVLFVDASHIRVRALRRGAAIPVRLLAVGFPLLLVLGGMTATLLFGGISLLAAAAISTILAPTDAALGQAVVTNERVPIGVRQGLSAESGLNDGLALPVLFTLIAVSDAELARDPWRVFLEQFVEEVGGGLLAGLVVGRLARAAISVARRSPLAPTAEAIGVATVGGLAAAVGLASNLGGSILIGAFVAGLAVAPVLQPVGAGAYEFGEQLVEVLTLLAFVVFGGVMLSEELGNLDWQIAVYAVLTLAVLRPAAVALSMLRSGSDLRTTLFLGWFGPRGLASILFVSTIVSQAPAFDDLDTITSVMTWTVLLSVVAHGLTAWPLANAYADHCAASLDHLGDHPANQPMAEEALAPRSGAMGVRRRR